MSLWEIRGFGEFLLALLDALNNARPLLEKLKEGLRSIRELEFGSSGLSVRIKKRPFTVTTQFFRCSADMVERLLLRWMKSKNSQP